MVGRWGVVHPPNAAPTPAWLAQWFPHFAVNYGPPTVAATLAAVFGAMVVVVIVGVIEKYAPDRGRH